MSSSTRRRSGESSRRASSSCRPRTRDSCNASSRFWLLLVLLLGHFSSTFSYISSRVILNLITKLLRSLGLCSALQSAPHIASHHLGLNITRMLVCIQFRCSCIHMLSREYRTKASNAEMLSQQERQKLGEEMQSLHSRLQHMQQDLDNSESVCATSVQSVHVVDCSGYSLRISTPLVFCLLRICLICLAAIRHT